MIRYFSKWFAPFGKLYGAVLWMRNKLYDKKIFRSEAPDFPLIVLGNLALGGTGKTPHTDYLMRMLSQRRIGVLSRGYGRSSKGFVEVSNTSTPSECGDEALLLKHKHPASIVAVDSKRLRGIELLRQRHPDLEAILLDDAMQHRKLASGLRILLTTWQRPFTRDRVLPAGQLRDHPCRARDAHAIVISKCPPESTESERQMMARDFAHLSCPVFFSQLAYGEPRAIDTDAKMAAGEFAHILLLSGIADASLFEAEARDRYPVESHFRYSDHHSFSTRDFKRIRDFIGSFAPGRAAVLTTEKDTMRLQPYLPDIKRHKMPIFQWPIEVRFFDGGEAFKQLIENYVGTR